MRQDPYFLSLKVLYRFRVGNRAVAYSALYHNSFSGIAVHETWHGTSVGGGSITSEREVRPIPFILVRSERILLNELIHCCMPQFLVHFFLPLQKPRLPSSPYQSSFFIPLTTPERYSGNILLWWRVGSENTDAVENDRMNRNPLILNDRERKAPRSPSG